jgi:Xaa-Pro dipeptidase
MTFTPTIDPMLSRRRFLISAAATPALPILGQEAQTGRRAEAAQTPNDSLPPAILALPNRRKDIVPITPEERGNRLDLARELMGQYKIGATLITTGSSLAYFTSGRWGQSERFWAWVLPQAAAPFVICPHFERDRFAEQLLTFPERETTITYLWQEDEDPYFILRRALGEANVTTGQLGIDEHTQFAFTNAIANACPGLKIVSATPITAGCRSIKSPAELACLRLANQITLDVYRAVYLSCQPGDTNRRVQELVAAAYTHSGVRGDASCNVGPNTAIPHGAATPQVIHEGEMVCVDDGCTVEGYTSDITRSWVYGKPTDEQRSLFEVVRNAQSAALAAAHPGVEMQAVDAAARKVIADAGFGAGFEHFYHRVGHGIGLDMHEWPYLVGGNKQKLVPGMVFSDEPGVYLEGKYGIRLEDDMHITEKGAELFTPQSPSLLDPFAIADQNKGTPAEPQQQH